MFARQVAVLSSAVSLPLINKQKKSKKKKNFPSRLATRGDRAHLSGSFSIKWTRKRKIVQKKKNNRTALSLNHFFFLPNVKKKVKQRTNTHRLYEKWTNVQWFAFCPLVRASLPSLLAGMAFNCLLFVGAGLLVQRQNLQGEWVQQKNIRVSFINTYRFIVQKYSLQTDRHTL